MLFELQIRNVGPIEQATIEPASGMTAITGETGAGKSMLLSALRMIAGQSTQSSRVGSNDSESFAQGVFAMNPALRAALGDQFIDDNGADDNNDDDDNNNDDSNGDEHNDDDELFVSRTVPLSGRSRACINGITVSRSQLASLAEASIAIHGQSDQLRLASPAKQREFVDGLVDSTVLDDYRNAWQQLQTTHQKLEELRHQSQAAYERADYIRESLAKIDATDPKHREDEELLERRTRIEHAEQIMSAVNEALSVLDASQGSYDAHTSSSVSQLLSQSIRALSSAHVDTTCQELARKLELISEQVQDVIYQLSSQVDSNLGDAYELDEINARIFELNTLISRWGPTLDDVIAWRDKARLELENLDASPQRIEELTAQRTVLIDTAFQAGLQLYESRQKICQMLNQHVNEELANLAMPDATFSFSVQLPDVCESAADIAALDTETKHQVLQSHGVGQVSCLIRPYPTAGWLPLASSASGGELSRIMLALELAASEIAGVNDDSMTFIFDEIDAGVGGKAAVEIGKRLARLATHAQVIVVTHVAQVASWAHKQYVVAKQSHHDALHTCQEHQQLSDVTTIVRQVQGEARVHEIARMLDGSNSEVSLDHARALLEESVLP